MAQFINQQNLAAMLNPQSANLGQLIGAPIAQGMARADQNQRLDDQAAQKQQALQQENDLRDDTAEAVAFLQQPKELWQQTLSAKYTEADEAGDYDERDGIGRLMQMDTAGLEQTMTEAAIRGSHLLPSGALQGAGLSGASERFHTPFEAIDPETNKPALFQSSSSGGLKRVDAAPLDKAALAQKKSFSSESGKLSAQEGGVAKVEGQKVKGRSQEQRAQDTISAGLGFATQLRDINRGLELVDQVSQGGVASITKDVTDFFGTTSGDVGELNRILAGNVIAGLANFKGAISDGERKFIEKMETSLSQGGAVNKAQLKRLKSVYERGIEKSYNLAKRSDDFAVLSSLEVDLQGSELGNKLFPKSKSTKADVGSLSDEDLFN